MSKVVKLLEKEMKKENSDYATLAKATLCAISIFNRKRGGEVQRMKLDDFHSLSPGESINENQDMMKTLSETEKKMVKFFERVEIRGKFNRTVPILLTKVMKQALMKITDMRKEMHCLVSDYMFATPTGTRPYKGCVLLKDFAAQAGVSDLDIFTYTNLRKQIATLVQSLEISNLEQDQLADFLGHDIRIHRSFYRLPQEVLQKAKVAKLLLALNRRQLSLLEKILEGEMEDQIEDAELEFDDENNANKSGKKAEQREKRAEKKRPKREESEREEMNASKKTRLEEDERGEEAIKMMEREEAIDMMEREEDERGEEARERQVQTSSDDELEYCPPRKKTSTRRNWTKVEDTAIKRFFRLNLITGKLPGLQQCQEALCTEPVFKGRTWRNLKDKVRNTIDKTKPKLTR